MQAVSFTRRPRSDVRWLNRTVLGIGLASLFSDWSHEIATTVMPAFLASMGAAAAWLGAIEGVSDGLSSFAKLASGFYTDRLVRRKKVAVLGYLVTTLGTGAIGLAASVSPRAYGRAFGFERMMDTLGAIAGPSSALLLLQATHSHYPSVFAWALVPGFLATVVITFLVQEKDRVRVPHVTFGESLRAMPRPFRKYVIGVGVFGLGDLAHTMLILLAAQKLAPELGTARAAGLAAGLYVLHNILYASFSLISGWLADRTEKRNLLAAGYFLAGEMATIIMFVPLTVPILAVVFVLGGIYVGIEETLEDSICAELVSEPQHGMAFGTLATVNGIGDSASSVIVGLLWTAFGTTIAFGYSAILFFIGALLIARLKRPRQDKGAPRTVDPG
jgi:MFS family permease